jgi:predicted Zn-dependent peptidase
MKGNLILFFVAAFVAFSCKEEAGKFLAKTGESNGFTYEYVTDDPLQVRVYTLKNGLKVYLSQYKAEPRVMASIAVKAGGKFDPANATGLAHYLEHIMFKGTSDFGTQDWKSEKILLDSIEQMFEHYRTMTDSMGRLAYYRRIDEVSNEASKFAIANEYDKMLSEIGGKDVNAYTTVDRTVYEGNIPSNQIKNWIQIEANRFSQIVPRLFHTELEAVYEEKNRTLDNDYTKTHEALYRAAFKNHPYGSQTVIGTIDHLKNPSITEIKKYFDHYYCPNNVAICLSGDLDYDSTISQIDKYFGSWKPNEELKKWEAPEAEEINTPVEVNVYGPDAEWVHLAFRFKGTSSKDFQLLRLTDMLLSNSQAGLMDLNLKQQQRVIEPASFVNDNNDYSLHTFFGKPREGQPLEEVKNLLLGQIDLVKKGQFDDWLIEAVINDLKKYSIEASQNNEARVNDEVLAFTNDIKWHDYTNRVEGLRKFTKQDIINFAKEHYKEGYVVVYKRNGKDPNQKKVTKPPITKVALNKESKSPFHEKLLANKVDKIQPVFLDYEKDIRMSKMKNDVEVLSTKNSENELFTLFYLSDVGTNNVPMMKQAVEYLEYLGTAEMTAEEVRKEFYKIGCTFGVYAANDRTYVYLNGLSENMDKAIHLFEKLLADPKPDDEALKKMIEGTFKKRDDLKKNKSAILWQGLMNYGLYGAKSPFTNVLTNKELRDLKSKELIDIIKGFTKTEHRVLYYGPKTEDELLTSLNAGHLLPDQLRPAPSPVAYQIQNMSNPSVYWTSYDMVQAEILFLSKGEKFDAGRIPLASMFNEYFGGGASPVFQEMREAQGLAYAAFASYNAASKKTDCDSFFGYVGTQADKQAESMKAMMGLIQNFPKSDNGFDVARNALLNQLESERVTKTGILFNYESAKRRGLDHDVRKDVYEQVQNMTIEDVSNFHKEFIKDRKFNVVLVGDQKKLNLKDLTNYGAVRELSLDEIFGYEKPVTVKLEAPNK